jgi:hypothetical protein
MKLQECLVQARKLAAPYRVTDGKRFRLKDYDPEDTGPFDRREKEEASELHES